MNLSALTVSVAAAVSPGAEPVTNQEIHAALNPEARVVALQQDIPKAPPLELGDEAPPLRGIQDPQKQEAPKQVEATPPAPEAKSAQDPAPQTQELSPDRKLDFSVAMQQLKTVNESVYKRILAGESIEQVMKEARTKLDGAFQNNETSLASIERALRDPEGLAAAQKEARKDIDEKNDAGFDLRENAYKERDIHHRFRKESEDLRQRLLDELREAMKVRKDAAGILHNAMEPAYLSNETLRGALTVTPMSKIVESLSPEAKKDLTILRSPSDPNSPLKPTEVRALTDAEKAALFDKVRPVEGNDPRPEFKKNRQEVMDKLSDADKAQLLELEKRALEVAKQELVMGVRGIPAGIEYHVVVDPSNRSRGPWQGIDNYAQRGIKMVYEGSIHLRDNAKACLKPKDINSCISALEALNSSR